MHVVFDLLGAGLALYTFHAAITGRVYAKHRAWGRTVTRRDEAGWFWTIIALYAGLAVLLVAWF